MRRAHAALVASVLLISAVTGGAATMLVNDPAADPGDFSTQSETTLAAWGSTLVAAWNDLTELLAVGVSWVGYGYSTDGGVSWTDGGLVPAPAGLAILGDPVLAVHGSGMFYLAVMMQDHSRGHIGVATASATTLPLQFTAPVPIPAATSTGIQDKPWLAVDSTGGAHDGRVYLCWKDRNVDAILFVRSNSAAGASAPVFDPAVEVAKAVKVHGCSIAIGPGGEVYVAYVTGWREPTQAIHLRKSADGGLTFGPATKVAANPPTGRRRLCTGFDPQVLNGNIRVGDFPSVAVDTSAGPSRGTVYVAFPADPDGSGPDASDVFVARSPASAAAATAGDPGESWSAARSIHKAPIAVVDADGTPNDNWMPAVAVSPASGVVTVAFYDRRHDPANTSIDVYRATSSDGGATWANRRVTVRSFGIPALAPNHNPLAPDCYMGEYNAIVPAPAGRFYLLWGDNSRTLVTAGFPNGRPDPDVMFEATGNLCDLLPSRLARVAGRRCAPLPVTNLYQDGMFLAFDHRDRVWVERFEAECRFKWPCPGCSPDATGYCPSFYNVVFDLTRAGLHPDVVHVALFDGNGRVVARATTVGGAKVLSFRPRGLQANGAGEGLFFAFSLGPKGQTKRRYSIPVRLEITDRPVAGTAPR